MLSYTSVSPQLQRWLSESVFDLMLEGISNDELRLLEALVTHRLLPIDLPDVMFYNLRTTDRAVFFLCVKELLFHILTQAEWYEIVEETPHSDTMTYDDIPDSAFKRAVKGRVFDEILRDATPRERESVQLLVDHMDRMPLQNDDTRSVYVGLRLMKLPLSVKDTTFFFYGVNLLLYQVLTPAEMRDIFLRTAKEDTVADNMNGSNSSEDIERANEARAKAEGQ